MTAEQLVEALQRKIKSRELTGKETVWLNLGGEMTVTMLTGIIVGQHEDSLPGMGPSFLELRMEEVV